MSNVFDKSPFFCKTKPNSPSVQMDLMPYITRDYINFRLCVRHKNKAKTKPKQTQTKPNCEMTKMNVNSMISDDYGKNPALGQNKNKANPASSGDYAGTSFLAPGPVSGSVLGVKKSAFSVLKNGDSAVFLSTKECFQWCFPGLYPFLRKCHSVRFSDLTAEIR